MRTLSSMTEKWRVLQHTRAAAPNNQNNLQEEFEDTKGVITIRISKNRQHNDQKEKYKRTNNDL